MENDKFMRRAVSLALRGTGYVSPNPRVGAVIVKNGEIISEGWHKKFGGPHAEVEAINNANLESFDDCELYVTLEPCSHHGKTPPCTDLIISKNFKAVYVGTIDPNPLVSGSGIHKLETAGIDVESGILEKECRWVNRFFIKYITEKMPYVVTKIAQSLDGCIATSSGESQWITGEESRKTVHALRAECDAVMVGRTTAMEDNPKLNVRYIQGRPPKRIILDSGLTLPDNLNIFNDENVGGTFIICAEGKFDLNRKEEISAKGLTVIPVDQDEQSRLNLRTAFHILAKDYGIASILVEGGAIVYSSLLEKDLIDELHIFIAPVIIGKGKYSFGTFHIDKLRDAPKLDIKIIRRTGKDMHVIAERIRYL